MRREFDSDKDVTRQFHLSDFRETIGFVIGKPELKRACIWLFCLCRVANDLYCLFCDLPDRNWFQPDCGWNDLFDCDRCCHTGPDFLGVVKQPLYFAAGDAWLFGDFDVFCCFRCRFVQPDLGGLASDACGHCGQRFGVFMAWGDACRSGKACASFDAGRGHWRGVILWAMWWACLCH